MSCIIVSYLCESRSIRSFVPYTKLLLSRSILSTSSSRERRFSAPYNCHNRTNEEAPGIVNNQEFRYICTRYGYVVVFVLGLFVSYNVNIFVIVNSSAWVQRYI